MKYLLTLLVLALVSSPIAAPRVTCKQFKTWAEANAYFKAKKPGYLKLDANKDGVPCEALRGGR